ncbi:MAG: PIG-L family deacetylase [Acidobacteriaceae bacterium]|nr:PIG-L family deacetylase [Acidobacteriaceae bacterium]MBV9779870.1 PIG-L family deacetylase [Acidobacteriaceae bacterium]
MAGAALRLPDQRGYVSDRDLEQLHGAKAWRHPLNIAVVGAHPDDPETGCGGTIAKLASDGHNVTIVYLTRGEAGIKGGDPCTTARLRTAEAIRGAEILGCRAVFANQIDGNTRVDGEHVECFTRLLHSLKPDLVFSHWPHDSHCDHRNAAELTRRAWEALGHSFTLAYYEVMAGIQTYDFEPNVYVDVSGTEGRKRAAIYAHACQRPDRFYPFHVDMEKERGEEAGVARAEAFHVVRQSGLAQVIPFPAREGGCQAST